MFPYPDNQKNANLLMQEYQHCLRQTLNIYYQSSSATNGQCVPIYFSNKKVFWDVKRLKHNVVFVDFNTDKTFKMTPRITLMTK